MILIVVGTALLGLLLGGVFGYAAGRRGPGWCETCWAYDPVDPVGMAMVMGGFGGVMCGGALGGFAVIVENVVVLVRDRRA